MRTDIMNLILFKVFSRFTQPRQRPLKCVRIINARYALHTISGQFIAAENRAFALSSESTPTWGNDLRLSQLLRRVVPSSASLLLRIYTRRCKTLRIPKWTVSNTSKSSNVYTYKSWFSLCSRCLCAPPPLKLR